MFPKMNSAWQGLTHWGQVTHICISILTIIGSDNGLSLGRRQAIIWTNAGIILIGPMGTNFSEILIEIYTFSFKKMHLKMSAKWWAYCLGLNVLRAAMVIGHIACCPPIAQLPGLPRLAAKMRGAIDCFTVPVCGYLRLSLNSQTWRVTGWCHHLWTIG